MEGDFDASHINKYANMSYMSYLNKQQRTIEKGINIEDDDENMSDEGSQDSQNEKEKDKGEKTKGENLKPIIQPILSQIQ